MTLKQTQGQLTYISWNSALYSPSPFKPLSIRLSKWRINSDSTCTRENRKEIKNVKVIIKRGLPVAWLACVQEYLLPTWMLLIPALFYPPHLLWRKNIREYVIKYIFFIKGIPGWVIYNIKMINKPVWNVVCFWIHTQSCQRRRVWWLYEVQFLAPTSSQGTVSPCFESDGFCLYLQEEGSH